ncbi:MAG: DUF790 family protein [Nitrososphaerota archaeon]|nr:DUF790 family protein [Nitrososphaerota archaeon]
MRLLYASPATTTTTELARNLIDIFSKSQGSKRGDLLQKLEEAESPTDDFGKKEGESIVVNHDYKIARGLSELLMRRCVFEPGGTEIDPERARALVFLKASKSRATSVSEVGQVISEAARELGNKEEDLQRSLWADLDEELIMKKFNPPGSAEDLIRSYNLSLAQTALFKCSRLEFTASGNWKNVFWWIKRLGLMYSVDAVAGSGNRSSSNNNRNNIGDSKLGYLVSLDGPLSLFKWTDRYGTSLAKLLPQIIGNESWRIKAEIVDKRKNRILSFEESSENTRGLFPSDEGSRERRLYDSSVEEKFAQSFASLGDTGWTLKREPEPLLTDPSPKTGVRHIVIPDFSFERVGERRKVYLEIVGFWTPEYLTRKLEKLSLLPKETVDIMIAMDEDLICSSGDRRKLLSLALNERKVVTYSSRKKVPLAPILEHLKLIDDEIVKREKHRALEMLPGLELKEDVIQLDEIASRCGISPQAMRAALGSLGVSGYSRIGDRLVSERKLEEARQKIGALIHSEDEHSHPVLAAGAAETAPEKEKEEGVSLLEANNAIQSCGLDPTGIIEALGYAIVWEGLDMAKSRVISVRTGTRE